MNSAIPSQQACQIVYSLNMLGRMRELYWPCLGFVQLYISYISILKCCYNFVATKFVIAFWVVLACLYSVVNFHSHSIHGGNVHYVCIPLSTRQRPVSLSPPGNIHYVCISLSTAGDGAVAVIHEAMAAYTEQTCITFRERTSEDKDWVWFYRGSG